MNSTSEYSLGEYIYEKQVWIDFLALLVVNYIAFCCYADSLRGGIENKDQLTQGIIKHGGDLNEGFMLAMICNICFLGLSYAGEKDLKSGLILGVKKRFSTILESKEKIRNASAIIGGILISVAEIFGIGNTADIKDMPAGLVGAGLFYVISSKNPYVDITKKENKNSEKKKNKNTKK